MSTRKLTIAIDGPAGSGKSTVARRVAGALRYMYIDTGAMFRTLTLAAMQQGTPLDDGMALGGLAANSDIQLIQQTTGYLRIHLNGDDVTDAIRQQAVNNAVSTVAAHPQVRDHFLKLQRSLAVDGGVVMDGRDIGTHVLPHADVKIFLTASPAERARRRTLQLARRGKVADETVIRQEISARDEADMNREVAPLKKATDAIEIDSTEQSIEQVVYAVLRHCRNKLYR